MSTKRTAESLDTTKRYFVEAFDKDFAKNLCNEISGNLTLGSVSVDPNFNQHSLWVESTMEQICHIRLANPKFAPGTLLSSPDGIQVDDDSFGLKACSADDEHVSIDIGATKEIEELGSTRRFLVSETIMVTDESIQIRKHVNLKVSDGINKSKFHQTCVYNVRHLIHALDNKRKVFVPTKLFKENNARWSGDLTMIDELDMSLIEKIYEAAKPEDIVAPLKIYKKQTP